MFVVVLILVWCAVFAVWSWLRPRLPSPPMYPGALPLVGHAHLLIGDALHMWDFEKKLFRFCLENDGIIQMLLGPHPVYVLADPDDSLVVANTCLGKPYFYNFAKEMYSSGLVTANVSTWKPHRRLLNPAFNQQVLNTFVAEYNMQARNLVSVLAFKVGEPISVYEYLVNNLLKTVCHTSLGLNTQDQSILDKDYIIATENLFAIFVERLQRIWLHLPYTYSWSSLKNKQDALIKIMNNIMNAVINKRKSELKANSYSTKEKEDHSSVKFKPLLDQMINLADNQEAFTDDDIREHLDTIVAAAFDTTATAMTYTLLVIGSDQDMQERIYKELHSVLGDEDRDLTKSDLTKLVYLEAVIKESLRLHSPVPMIARSVQTDVKLKNYTLQAGSSCVISMYGINRHPMWGADADEFKPERWLNPETLPENVNAFATFSLGKRNCIGKLYAMMVMKTTLAHIVRRYRITGNVSNVQTQCDIIIKPVNGHKICLELRT